MRKTISLQLAMQFFKFSLVGLSNTLISLAIYYGLIYLSVHYLFAYICSFVSILNAYYWNSRYVFSVADKNHARAFSRMFFSYLITFLFSFCFLYLLVDVLTVSEWVAPGVSLVVTTVANFILNRFWAFKMKI